MAADKEQLIREAQSGEKRRSLYEGQNGGVVGWDRPNQKKKKPAPDPYAYKKW